MAAQRPPAVDAALDRYRKAWIADWEAEPDRRHERFIKLEVAPLRDDQPGPPRVFEALTTLMAEVPAPAVLLVGPPGAGKTTAA